MRKYHQQQILELIKTIKTAQAAKQYGECQEAALSVCDFVDSLKGEGTKTVALLENYCELLFKAYNGEIGEKFLRKHMNKIENSVRHELKPNRIEVVFISHKASMSDSIASVYHAAKADPRCDAYWMPVPYYDRKSGGTMGAMHYEGPEHYHFDTVDWRSYDIEARCPDIIFTFNAYDDQNFVTSIHSDFYNSRLRDLTDMLVYVPYFTSFDYDLVNYPEHFASVSACIFAHKVMLQSEAMRNFYVRIFKAQYGNQFGRPEDKFIALGSPKFDAAINAREEDYVLPVDWIKIVEGKKVILYNTTVGSILKGNEQYLKKLRSVLDFFRKQKDVALWWRPHPLTEATYDTMRPILLAEYEKIVSEYKREGWGIFDDSVLLQRAIAYSDAYYGDGGSSLVLTFGITGKPVMLQNASILSFEESRGPAYVSPFLEDNTHFWFVSANFNGLFKMDKTSWKPEYMGSFPDTPALKPGSGLYWGMTEYSNHIYFAPTLGKNIASYNKNTGTFKLISFNRAQDKSLGQSNFLGAIQRNDYIFFTPCMYPAIIRFNTRTEELDYYSGWLKEIDKQFEAPVYFTYPLRVDENTFILASFMSNQVLEFNMDTCTSRMLSVGPKGYYYDSICFDGEYYWLTRAQDSSIVKWDAVNGTYKEFFNLYDNGQNVPENVRRQILCVFCGGFVWIVNNLAPWAIKINAETDEILDAPEITPAIIKTKDRVSDIYTFMTLQNLENTVYTYEFGNGAYISYNCETNERREEPIWYSANMIPALPDLNPTQPADCHYTEFSIHGLPEFADYIVHNYNSAANRRQADIFKKSYRTEDKTNGERIYEYCLKQII